MDRQLRTRLSDLIHAHRMGASVTDTVNAIEKAVADAGYYKSRPTLTDIDPNAPDDLKVNSITIPRAPRQYSEECPF